MCKEFDPKSNNDEMKVDLLSLHLWGFDYVKIHSPANQTLEQTEEKTIPLGMEIDVLSPPAEERAASGEGEMGFAELVELIIKFISRIIPDYLFSRLDYLIRSGWWKEDRISIRLAGWLAGYIVSSSIDPFWR